MPPRRQSGEAFILYGTDHSASEDAQSIIPVVVDSQGRLLTRPIDGSQVKQGATGDITDTTSTQVIAAPGAGQRLYITAVTITNAHATVGTWVNIQDGSGGSILHSVFCRPDGGGEALTLPTPLRFTANTGAFVAAETTGAEVRAAFVGYAEVEPV